MKKAARLGLILALPTLLVAGLAFSLTRTERPAPPMSGSPAVLRDAFVKEIEQAGPVRAYAAFKARYGREGFDTQHNAAHLFGEALFAKEGVPGVASCDADFNFGCYHGFFKEAVSISGLDVVSALDAACAGSTQSASACQHGIGHGILEFLGHNNLVAGLEACGRTNQPDPLAGCTSGVFMEYNVPLVAQGDGTYTVDARPLMPEEPFAPCPTLPGERFQMSCYQELPQWWKQVLGDDFKKMGAYCSAVASRANQEACFGGIAKIVPSSSAYQVEASERACALMPPGWYDSCIMNASWALQTNVGQHEDARRLCAYAGVEMKSRCPQ